MTIKINRMKNSIICSIVLFGLWFTCTPSMADSIENNTYNDSFFKIEEIINVPKQYDTVENIGFEEDFEKKVLELVERFGVEEKIVELEKCVFEYSDYEYISAKDLGDLIAKGVSVKIDAKNINVSSISYVKEKGFMSSEKLIFKTKNEEGFNTSEQYRVLIHEETLMGISINESDLKEITNDIDNSNKCSTTSSCNFKCDERVCTQFLDTKKENMQFGGPFGRKYDLAALAIEFRVISNICQNLPD